MPGLKQAWPNSAACWSPRMAATGTPSSAAVDGTDARRARPCRSGTCGRAHLGQRVRRDAEDLTQLGRPGEVGGVEEHGAAGVGGVGGVDAALGPSGEVPENPRVDGAERQSRVVRGERELARAQEPGGLGGAEIRIEHEAGPLAHEREVAGSPQLVTHRRGAPVLPHDGAVQGTSVRPIEGDERLALVGDADGGDLCSRSGEAASELGQGGPDRIPDLLRTVLDPARAGEVLGELPVGHVGDPAPLVDGDGADAGGAGVDGDHGGHRGLTLIGAPQDIGVAGSGRRPFPAQTIANGL